MTYAFPSENSRHPGLNEKGMGLRDWFAGQALAAIVWHDLQDRREEGRDSSGPDDIATAAYMIADALLTERDRGSDFDVPEQGQKISKGSQ